MWTATISSINKNGKGFEIVITYNDGQRNFDEGYQIEQISQDLIWLRRQVRDRIKNLTIITTFVNTLSSGSDIIPLADNLPPTQSEIDRQIFMVNWGRWQTVKMLIDAGILTGSEPKVLVLKTKVQNDFKSEYFDIT